MTATQLGQTTAPPADPRWLPALAAELAGRRDLWPSDVRFDRRRRWYGRVRTDGTFDAWLLTWLPGQTTGLHDHGEASGAFFVVEGVLRETAVTLHADGVREVVRTYRANQVRPFGSWHVHDMINDGRGPAISLHVYTPGLAIMRRYRRYGDALVQVAAARAGEDW